ncbi:MAG: hypothetical protein HY810_00200 [Candidatus Omnitrophica bacterium]|nr:hypothetical protein [Candidatus Omnitrophota bacterium]
MNDIEGINSVESIKAQINRILTAYAKEFPSQGVIFSGGLDSSIAAFLYKGAKLINVSLENYSSDLMYAAAVEKYLNTKVDYVRVSVDEALEKIPEVIRILKSFDPALPNDLAAYFAIARAKGSGIKSIATGDGADELFGGYGFMQQIKGLKAYIRRISQSMFFSSNVFAEHFNLEIRQPFIRKEMISLANEDTDTCFKIRQEKGALFGKWILRKAFEGFLPDEIIWQSKRPLEFGSGMTKMREIISEKISDDDFEKKTKDYGIKFITKDHLYYYEIYRGIFGAVPKPQSYESICPGCKTGIEEKPHHCRVCGWVKSIDGLCLKVS